MTKITFVRHTRVDVSQGICYGQTDVGLAPSFAEEAAIVKHRLEDKAFDAAYTSPLSRCVALAEYCGYGNALKDRRLMELNFGRWEMQRFDDIADPRLQMWYDDYFNVAPTGGESWTEQGERVAGFITELTRRGHSNPVVFTHAGVIMHAMLLAGIINRYQLFDHRPDYGAIVELKF